MQNRYWSSLKIIFLEYWYCQQHEILILHKILICTRSLVVHIFQQEVDFIIRSIHFSSDQIQIGFYQILLFFNCEYCSVQVHQSVVINSLPLNYEIIHFDKFRSCLYVSVKKVFVPYWTIEIFDLKFEFLIHSIYFQVLKIGIQLSN